MSRGVESARRGLFILAPSAVRDRSAKHDVARSQQTPHRSACAATAQRLIVTVQRALAGEHTARKSGFARLAVGCDRLRRTAIALQVARLRTIQRLMGKRVTQGELVSHGANRGLRWFPLSPSWPTTELRRIRSARRRERFSADAIRTLDSSSSTMDRPTIRVRHCPTRGSGYGYLPRERAKASRSGSGLGSQSPGHCDAGDFLAREAGARVIRLAFSGGSTARERWCGGVARLMDSSVCAHPRPPLLPTLSGKVIGVTPVYPLLWPDGASCCSIRCSWRAMAQREACEAPDSWACWLSQRRPANPTRSISHDGGQARRPLGPVSREVANWFKIREKRSALPKRSLVGVRAGSHEQSANRWATQSPGTQS